MARPLAIGVGLLLGLAAAHAWADRIAVATPRVLGGTPVLRESVRRDLEGGVAAAGHAAIPAAEIDAALASTPAIAACDTDVCLRRLGQLVSARAVVRAVIEVLGSSHYTLRLELVLVDEARSAARVDDACPVCTTREANEAVSRAAAALVAQLPPAPDLEAARTAPRDVVAATPDAATVPPTRLTSSRARLHLGLAIASGLLGAGALAGGAVLLAFDGRTRYETDPQTGDPLVLTFEGKLPGAILVAGGALLLVGGGLFAWRAAVHRAAAR